MLLLNNEFEIGQIVYLKTDKDQSPRMVTGINVRQGNSFSYILTCGTMESGHWPAEISDTKDVLTATDN